LTQALGDAKGNKPKPADAPCEETLAVSVSPENGKRRDRDRGSVECSTAKTTSDRSSSKNLCGRSARIFANKEIDQSKVKIDNIIRIDWDGDGEEEVLISATNYFKKDDSVPMRSPAAGYSMVLLRRVVAGKVGNAIDCRRILSQGLPEGRTRRGALQRDERLQSDRDAGSGWGRQNGNRRRI
jgi:hypothetical protein